MAMQSPDDEKRWRDRVRWTLGQETAEELCAAAKVFDVPRALRDTKPEAYAPHLFALGPYHQDRPELRNMERYKLAAVKRVQKRFAGSRKIIDQLVGVFLESVYHNDVQATYHRYLELEPDTLALMMVIDTCFLLDFLLERYGRGGEVAMASSACNWSNAVVRDAVMLENQVPLFLFYKTFDLCGAVVGNEHEQTTDMDAVLDRFVKHVSPIKVYPDRVMDKPAAAHLLELLYRFLVPDAAVFHDNNSGGRRQDPPALEHHHHIHINVIVEETTAVHHDDDVAEKQDQQLQPLPDSEKVKQACLQVSRLRFVDGLTRKVPVLAGVMRLLSMVASTEVNGRPEGTNNQGGGSGNASNSSPLAEEIKVPSVTELAECGVRFAPAPDGIAGIAFDRATLTLKLPVMELDANTEVVLRNLVAYEAVAAPREAPLVLARYTELMNGIIDTGKDVKLLKKSGVVAANRMKSNKEAAAMWNGMCRAARLSRVPRLDAVVRALNEHRNATARARATKLITKYVFGSWKMLTLLASVVLLLMTAMQTFCSAYPCDRTWFGALMQVPESSPDS